jgi:hypothetical protein
MDKLTLSTIPQNRANYPAISLAIFNCSTSAFAVTVAPLRFTSRLLQSHYRPPLLVSPRSQSSAPLVALVSAFAFFLPFPNHHPMSSLQTHDHFIDTLHH